MNTIDVMMDSPTMEVSRDGKVLVTRTLAFTKGLTVWNAGNGARLRDVSLPQGRNGLTAVMSRDGSVYALKPYGLATDLRTGGRAWDKTEFIAEISADGRYLLILDRRSFLKNPAPTPELRAGAIVDRTTQAMVALPNETDLLESSAWALPSNKFLLNHDKQWRLIDPTGAKATVAVDTSEPYPAPPADELAKLFRNEPSDLVRVHRATADLTYVRETASGVEVYALPLIPELRDVGHRVVSPNGRYIALRDDNDRAKLRIWDGDKPIVDKTFDERADVLGFHPTEPWVYVAFRSDKYATGMKVSALHLPDLAPVYDLGNAGIGEVTLSLGATGLEVAAAVDVGDKDPKTSRGTVFGLSALAAGRNPVLIGPDQPLTELKVPPPRKPGDLSLGLDDLDPKVEMTGKVRELLGFSSADDADILTFIAKKRAAADKALNAAVEEQQKAFFDGNKDPEQGKKLEEQVMVRKRERDAVQAGAFGLSDQPLGGLPVLPGSIPDRLAFVRNVENVESGSAPLGSFPETYKFRGDKAASGEANTISVRPFATGPRKFELIRIASPDKPPVTIQMQDDRVRSEAGSFDDGLLTTLKSGAVVTRHQSGQIAVWDGRTGRLIRTVGTECSARTVQEALRGRGFYKGAANGRLDQDVRAAIKKHFADIRLGKDDLLPSGDDDKGDAQKATGLDIAQFKNDLDLLYFTCESLGFFGHYLQPTDTALVEGSDVLVTGGEDGLVVSDLASGKILGRAPFGPQTRVDIRVGFGVLGADGSKPTLVPLKPGRDGGPAVLAWPEKAAGQKAVFVMNPEGLYDSYNEIRWLRWPDLAPIAKGSGMSGAEVDWRTDHATVDRAASGSVLGRSIVLAGQPAFAATVRAGMLVTATEAKSSPGPVPYPVFTDPHVLSSGRAVAGLDGNRLLVSSHTSGELAVWDTASGAYLRSLGVGCSDETVSAELARLKPTDEKGAPIDVKTHLDDAIAVLFEARELKRDRADVVKDASGETHYQDVPIKPQAFSDAAHRRNIACAMLGLYGHDNMVGTVALSKVGPDDTAPQLMTVSENAILVSDPVSGRTVGLARFGGKIQSIGAGLLRQDDQSIAWQQPAGAGGGVVDLVWPKPSSNPGSDPARVLVVRTEGGSVYRLGFPDLTPQAATERGPQQVNVWSLQPRRSLKMVFLGSAAGEWIGLTADGFFAASPQGSEMVKLVRGMDSYPLGQVPALSRPDLLLELWKGDPAGKYKDAAGALDLKSLVPH